MPVTFIPAQKIDLSPAARIAMAAVAALLTGVALFGAARWALGLAPATPWVRSPALAIHLMTVIPALPLGAYVMLAKKGGTRHRVLGRLWVGMMAVTAVATLFVRNINDGAFSYIHLLTLLTFIAVPQAIVSARRRQFDAHRRHLRNFFVGALLIAGLFSFLPGRLMWQWVVDTPADQRP